jgi:wyosine [tRNA(Phe)-imidazoG37] synthetase (radical SAM superfamily)
LTDRPDSTEFHRIDYNPNSINYYNRFKEQLKEIKEGKIKIKRNIITTVNISDAKFKEYIKRIDDEKYELSI